MKKNEKTAKLKEIGDVIKHARIMSVEEMNSVFNKKYVVQKGKRPREEVKE